MYIFDRTESFLPEFKLDGGIELSKSCVQMVLEGIGIGEVDGVLLMRIFRNI
jgi:hypothetical protein